MTVTKDDLKCRIEDYAKGELTESRARGKFICPVCGSGTGPHKTAALSIDTKTDLFKCFACGTSGDIYDLAGIVNGISNTADTFPERLRIVADYFGETVEGSGSGSGSYTPAVPKKKSWHYWNRPILEKSWTDLKAYDYRDARGEVVGTKFKGLNENGEKDSRWEIKIVSEGKKNEKLTSVKNGLPPLYNLPELLASEEGNILFVCEGEKDADRLLEEGQSLGWVGVSVPNGAADQVSLKIAAENYDILEAFSRVTAIVTCGDFDEAGEKYNRNIKKIFDNSKVKTPILKLSWAQLDPEHCKGHREKEKGKVTGKYAFDLGEKYDISDFFDNHDEAEALDLLKSHVQKKLDLSQKNRKSAEKRTDKVEENSVVQEEEIDVSEIFGSVDSSRYPNLQAYIEEYARMAQICETWIAKAEEKERKPSNSDVLTVAYYQNLKMNIQGAPEEILELADLVCASAVVRGKRPCVLMDSQVKRALVDYYNGFIQDGALWAYRPDFGDYFPLTAAQINGLYNSVATVLDGFSVQSKKQTFGDFVVSSDTPLEGIPYPEKRFVAFKNGTLDVEKMELVEHSPDHHLKFSIDAHLDLSLVTDDQKWAEVKSRSAYYQFLHSVLPDPEDEKIVDAFGALLLSPHAAEVQSYFCPYGTGANGKSVLLNFWKSLIRDFDSRVADISVEALTKDTHQSEILIGKTHVICDDASDLSYSAIDAEFFKKAVTGGDLLINPKNRKNFNVRPNLFMCGAANRLPVSQSNLNAAFRRLTPLEFTAKAGTKEEVERGEKLIVKDVRLLDRLKAEKNFVAAAYVRALKDLKSSWTIPETTSLLDAKEDFKTNSSSLQRFILEFCEVTGSQDDLVSQHLFHDFLHEFALSENSQAKVPSIRSISQQIKSDARIQTVQIYDTAQKRRIRYYTGIRVDGWQRQRLAYRFNDNDVKEKLLSKKWSITEVTKDNLDFFTPPTVSDKDREIERLKAEVESLRKKLDEKYYNELLSDPDFTLVDDVKDVKKEQKSASVLS